MVLSWWSYPLVRKYPDSKDRDVREVAAYWLSFQVVLEKCPQVVINRPGNSGELRGIEVVWAVLAALLRKGVTLQYVYVDIRSSTAEQVISCTALTPFLIGHKWLCFTKSHSHRRSVCKRHLDAVPPSSTGISGSEGFSVKQLFHVIRISRIIIRSEVVPFLIGVVSLGDRNKFRLLCV